MRVRAGERTGRISAVDMLEVSKPEGARLVAEAVKIGEIATDQQPQPRSARAIVDLICRSLRLRSRSPPHPLYVRLLRTALRPHGGRLQLRPQRLPWLCR